MSRVIRSPWAAAILATVLTASLIGVVQIAQAVTERANLAFTGCLEGGRLVNVARGLQPRDVCRSASRQVSWSVQGPEGPAGADGKNGTDGVSGYVRVQDIVTLGTEGSSADYDMNCPAGKQPLGSGWGTADGFKRMDLWRDLPGNPGESDWRFTYTVEPGGEGRTALFYLTCANVTGGDRSGTGVERLMPAAP